MFLILEGDYESQLIAFLFNWNIISHSKISYVFVTPVCSACHVSISVISVYLLPETDTDETFDLQVTDMVKYELFRGTW